MKIAAQSRDVERLVVDYLTDHLPADEVKVGIGVPDGWTLTSLPHVSVTSDGEPFAEWPVITHASVRLVAYAKATTTAKFWCATAAGTLLAHPGGEEIAQTRYLTGVQPARDPDTNAELAAATVRVTVRTEPIEEFS